MNAFYLHGIRVALAKFGASTDVPHGNWFMEPTTTPDDRSSAISRAFDTNAAQGDSSSMSTPSAMSNVLRGGPPTIKNPSDEMGGIDSTVDSPWAAQIG